VCACPYMPSHRRSYIYIYIHINTYIHTYIYTYIHTYIHTYAYAHTYHTYMQRTTNYDDDIISMGISGRRLDSDSNGNDWDWGNEIQARANSHETHNTLQARADSRQENHTQTSRSPGNSVEDLAQQRNAQHHNPSWRAVDDAVRVLLHIQRGAQKTSSTTSGA
jgi:hypothetical protein